MNPFRVIAFAAVAAGVALLGAIGRRPAAYSYVGRHNAGKPRRMPVQLLKSSLSWRVRRAGAEQPVAPLPEEPTVSLLGNGVVALGQLAARQQAPKSTPGVIEPHETGIGILQPVVDLVDDQSPVHFGFCTSTLVVEDDPHTYECEKEDDDKHGDTCSAFGGEVTWPRTAVLEVAA